MTNLRLYILMAGLTALFVTLGFYLGGKNGILLALMLAAGMNFWAYWFSDRAVLAMHNAFEVGAAQAPELHGVVVELARRANMPMPRVYLIEDPSPNAFATGRNPRHAAVAATTGLLRILTREELAGVMAHEMIHVKNHDILVSTITATLAGAITTSLNIAQWGTLLGGRSGQSDGRNGLGSLLMVLLAPLAAMLIQMAVSRTREYGADEGGAQLCGNPLWLASALGKLRTGSQRFPLFTARDHPATAHLFIVSPLTGRVLAGLFSTHPPIEERVARLHWLANQ